LYIVFTLVIGARRASIARGARVGQLFTSISLYTIAIWTLYPIVWALGEGTQKVSVDTEILLYAVVRPPLPPVVLADDELDILAKGIFGGWLLVAHSRIQESHVPLTGWWIDGSGALDASEAERRRLLDED